jgi:hypothetical protein
MRRNNLIKYEKEIDKILSWFHEDWMNEDDKKELNNILLEEIGLSYESLSNDIEKGVNNGFSVEKQLSYIIKILGITKEKFN